jgi:hypothetical protein
MCILYNKRDATYTMLFIIISALHVSGGFYANHQELIKLYVQPWVLSCFPAVYRWCGWVGTNSSILLLVANGHHNCIICTKADVRLRTPDDGQKSPSLSFYSRRQNRSILLIFWNVRHSASKVKRCTSERTQRHRYMQACCWFCSSKAKATKTSGTASLQCIA